MTSKPLSRRNFLRLTALAAGGAALAACAPEETATPTSEQPGEAPPAGEKTTLRMWSHQNVSFVTANEHTVARLLE